MNYLLLFFCLSVGCAAAVPVANKTAPQDCQRVMRLGSRIPRVECDGDQPAGGTDVIRKDMLPNAMRGAASTSLLTSPPGPGVQAMPRAKRCPDHGCNDDKGRADR